MKLQYLLSLSILVILSFTTTQAFSQSGDLKEKLKGCWTNVHNPSNTICFEDNNQIIFKNDNKADKTIDRKWWVKNNQVQIKFVNNFKPDFEVEWITQDHIKLIPVETGTQMELKRS